MTGNEAYEEQFKKKSDNLINNNPDKPYLKGFYNSFKAKYSTKHSYLYHVVSFMNYIKKDVNKLTLDDYNEYMASIENLTSGYQIGVYSGLKKFSNYLYVSKKCTENPMKDVDRPEAIEGIRTKKKREVGYLDDNEIEKYVNSVSNGAGSELAISRQREWKERDDLIIKLLLYTGLRCSALFKLNVSNIDFENQKLIAVDKGGKIPEIILTEDIIIYINNWIEKRKDILGNIKEDALFISNQRRRMDQSSIARVVKKYAKNITEKNITPHKLRATYGTCLLKETNDIYFVQECMGHANPKTTELYIRGQNNVIMEKSAYIMSKKIK